MPIICQAGTSSWEAGLLVHISTRTSTEAVRRYQIDFQIFILTLEMKLMKWGLQEGGGI